jgi:hypothetical protein
MVYGNPQLYAPKRNHTVNSQTEDVKNPRGVFERPPGSGVWWINYYEHGNQHREKVGRKGDAIKLYGIRKADILRGHKLPPMRRVAQVLVADLNTSVRKNIKTCGRMRVEARLSGRN